MTTSSTMVDTKTNHNIPKDNNYKIKQLNRIDRCPPSDLIFDSILSSRSAYGLIWLGRYHQHSCVIKMVMLTSGIHYDKKHQTYQSQPPRPSSSHSQTLSQSQLYQYFLHNDQKPFLHCEFKHRRAMTIKEFLTEVSSLAFLSRHNLGPKVYGYGLNRSHPIHYGFIVMERVDCTLKDLLALRKLKEMEIKLILSTLEQFHQQYHLIHGDLKPTNIGLFLSPNGQLIQRVVFLDCLKIVEFNHTNPSQSNINLFNHYVQKETNSLRRHLHSVIQN